jgi:7-keto-8-aminopelargonate synthetase-like enzyme
MEIDRRLQFYLQKPEALEPDESLARAAEVLNRAEVLPFPIDDPEAAGKVNEELRLQYRYLDLRRPVMAKNLPVAGEVIRFQAGEISVPDGPVIPVIVGPIEGTFVFWKELLKGGVFTNPVIPPAVPENGCLIRTSVMASHTEDQLSRALEIFRQAGRAVGLI